MLQSLHVKNLALMEETEVEFAPGLNILTGETGAGKSLLIGSINLALGGKFDKDMLRKGTDTAFVEMVFTQNGPKVAQKLKEMDLEGDEDTVIITRKLQVGKSTCKINGETVTARQVKELAEYLLDMHGQHEHQSLLHKSKHLEILDEFCGEALRECAMLVKKEYAECRQLGEQLEEETLDDTARERERALAEFELQEILQAKLVAGEDEELERRYRVMTNSRKITENLGESYRATGQDMDNSAGMQLSRALRAVRSISGLDDRLAAFEEQLVQIDNLLADYNRDVADYLTDCEFDEEEFATTEDRLNLLNRLKDKYGGSIEATVNYAQEKQQLLDKYEDYDAYMEGLQKELSKHREILEKHCKRLTELRKAGAERLEHKLQEALVQLNFLSVDFHIAVTEGKNITGNGWDDVEFLISTNPGEPCKPLGQVASGGELSRVMLAIKTVLAGQDEIDTLIFDEIDTGISGKTAWRVAQQLVLLSQQHQVLCITHLAQIAAMADCHLMIEKSLNDNHTITDVHQVEDEESLAELARLLGSDELTRAALSNAGDIRAQAEEYKKAVRL